MDNADLIRAALKEAASSWEFDREYDKADQANALIENLNNPKHLDQIDPESLSVSITDGEIEVTFKDKKGQESALVFADVYDLGYFTRSVDRLTERELGNLTRYAATRWRSGEYLEQLATGKEENRS